MSSRSAFGEYAQKLRILQDVSLNSLAGKMNEPASLLSNSELGKRAISKKLLSGYQKHLARNDLEKQELATRADFSNRKRTFSSLTDEQAELLAWLETSGHTLSVEALVEIRSVILKYAGHQGKILTLSRTIDLGGELWSKFELRQSVCGAIRQYGEHLPNSIWERIEDLWKEPNERKWKKTSTAARKTEGRMLENERAKLLDQEVAANIAIFAQILRERHTTDRVRLDVGRFIEVESMCRDDFDYLVTKRMPFDMQGAFSATVGSADTLFCVLDEYYFREIDEGWFPAGLALHEYYHTVGENHKAYLGNDYLFIDEEIAASELHCMPASRNAMRSDISGPLARYISANSARVRVLDEEADFFALCIQIPWRILFKAFHEPLSVQQQKERIASLSIQYRVDRTLIKRFVRQWKLSGLGQALQKCLERAGVKPHPFFGVP